MESIVRFEQIICWVVLFAAVVGILYALLLVRQILREDVGEKSMVEIAKGIQDGAKAYLHRQFKAILFFIVILAIGLYLTAETHKLAIGRSIAFLMGALFSGLTGYIGMSMAVRGNVRTAQAARSSYTKALKLAFRTGSITGMFCVGLGLLGATVIYMIYGQEKPQEATEVLVGFGFGGCLLALFMRVGGGIYTKAADVGADLVGKVEAGIPEDDPRNAAVIADNVGDNVGDCAGMAADLFESYEVTLVAAMILGMTLPLLAGLGMTKAELALAGVLFPLIVRAIGVLTSILGTYLVQARSEKEHAMWVIQRAFIISTLLSAVLSLPVALYLFKEMGWKVFGATFFGIILAIVISLLTEYFTTTERAPVKEIARSTQTGPATTILSGFAVGLESSVWAILCIAGAIAFSFLLFKGNIEWALYGISLCGMGMLTTTGVIVSMDSYGPVTDNAHGIQEMAKIKEKKTEEITTRLDAVGNTTKAITKGFAIATAVVAAISLFSSYISSIKGSGIENIRLDLPLVFVGFLIGGAAVFLFSSLTVRAVGRTAHEIINEVRWQFKNIKGLMEGEAKPDYARCVDICTTAAQKELLGPGILAVLLPIIVGFLFGAEALGGYLGGIILTGQLMAVFMANAGGAWDNAKKIIEYGAYGGKGTDCHKAGVIGDTVGDPLKDTAGPAINPLIKVMNLVALLIAPLIIKYQPLNIWAIILIILAILILIFGIARSKKEAFGKITT